MPKFTKTIDLHQLDHEQIAKLPRGQWVSAGPVTEPAHRGIFCGVRDSGSVVVLWMGNAQGRDFRSYRMALMQYGKSDTKPVQQSSAATNAR